MILQALYRFHERIKADSEYALAAPGNSIQKISFRAVLRPDGTLFEFQPVYVQEGKRQRPRQMAVPGQGKPSGSGINPCFLWDNGGYMLGYKPDDPKPERSLEAFQAFRDRHLSLEAEIDCPSFSTVCRFLEQWRPETAEADHPELRDFATGFGVFQIVGESSYVHEDAQVRAWWDAHIEEANGGVQGQCLLTGEQTAIARLQPKIKGVSGGKAEALLVAFNEKAYESYGKEQGFNAPVGEDAARAYGAALNALLDGPVSNRHRFGLGDATVAFWTEKPTATEDIFVQFARDGETAFTGDDVQDHALLQKLRAFLEALRKGREAYGELDDDADRTAFCLLGLSPNAARLSVRFFHSGTLGELLTNLRRHFADIAIAPRPAKGKRKADPEFPPTWLLLSQTARESKEIPPLLAGPLLRAVITGSRYPQGLFSAIMRRIRVGDAVNYAKACAIKGHLKRNVNMEVNMSLDTQRTDPGYRMGRLFAVLEKTQADAIPGVNASIRDRFYSSASATPRSVFPRLLRTYQHHLAKLQIGHKVNREKLVQEITSTLAEFPAHLSLAEQGLFALGYYHQTQDFYTPHSDSDEA